MRNIFKKIITFSTVCIALIIFSGCDIILPVFHENPNEEDVLYTVTLVAGTGGTVGGASIYVSGTNVTITAVSNNGYEFVSWNNGDEIVSTNPVYQFVISENVTLTAYFEEIAIPSYTVSIQSSLHGTVSGAGTYTQGSQVLLRAVPNIHYIVIAWIINGVTYETSSLTRTLTMDRDYTVRVAFILDDVFQTPIE